MTAFSKNLTEIYGDEDEVGKWKTPTGCAHWSGTGQKGRTCRECDFWTGSGKYRYATAKTGEHMAHELKPGQRTKYKQLTGRLIGKIPHRTEACKYFNEAERAPAITERPKY